MGKRSDFKRNARDKYDTPYSCVVPLIPHLKYTNYIEPCAGKGWLMDHLAKHGMNCVMASDIEPERDDIYDADYLAYTLCASHSYGADCFITNPPWDRKILHPMILTLSQIKPTWLLFDTDWMHTKQAIPYLKFCEKIVSVGRAIWIPGTKQTGKDNVAWYLFQKNTTGPTKFFGRT